MEADEGRRRQRRGSGESHENVLLPASAEAVLRERGLPENDPGGSRKGDDVPSRGVHGADPEALSGRPETAPSRVQHDPRSEYRQGDDERFVGKDRGFFRRIDSAQGAHRRRAGDAREEDRHADHEVRGLQDRRQGAREAASARRMAAAGL
ncbi:hypothetical protein SDC9_191531 [bioreactor metagenome]|uniref:Uncharacterized protein n=1 Tax=bioreactor metagenome TaxID=1076179 RepID=A0A645HYJ7_9ZZZZ